MKTPNTLNHTIALALLQLPGWTPTVDGVEVQLARVATNLLIPQLASSATCGDDIDLDAVADALRDVPGWMTLSPSEITLKMAAIAAGAWADRLKEALAQANGQEPPPRKPGTRVQ